MPFLQYLLGIILKSYREFESRVEHIVTLKLVKKIGGGRATAYIKL